MEFKVGDRVVVVKSKRAKVGLKGTVIHADCDRGFFGVEFDEPVDGCHSGGGKYKDGHCWYYCSELSHDKRTIYGTFENLTKVGKKNNFY